MATNRRALHFVFKVGDRKETARFYREVLGMKFLRHEEFVEGCKAACNGPYDGKWSKSMVGFGPEDNHFVIELTYNYGIGTYRLGNDFKGIHIQSKEILNKARAAGWPVSQENGQDFVTAPGGYRFYVTDTEPTHNDPVERVTLGSSDLKRSLVFWRDKLQMTVYTEQEDRAILGYSDQQAKVELVDIHGPVDHATAFGRIAFSCPTEQLEELEREMRDSGQTILTPLVKLDTPGKATVQVVILADPDGHEICLVGDEAFRELSQVDPEADNLLEQGLAADKSDEWYAKKGKAKSSA